MKNLNRLFNLSFAVMLAASVLFFNSCKDEDNTPGPTNTSGKYEGVFVINEGGFLKGNSSVDFMNAADASYTEGLFKKVNNLPLGDIMQSMTKVGSSYYLVVNNSQKIEVVNASDFKSTATIDNLGSPRYLLALSSSGNKTAYVTDLFAGEIHIIDLATAKKTGSISLAGWNEHLLEANNAVYVDNWTNKMVYEINPTNHTVTDSIVLTGAPNGLVKDKNGKLWILADSTGTTQAKLLRVNPADNSTEATIDFPVGQSASKLAINGSGDKLYYTNSVGVFEMDITATAVPATAKKTGSFYGLGIDPKDGSIYVSDPLDYNQKGVVYRIKSDGTESNFKAGIVPGGFYFSY